VLLLQVGDVHFFQGKVMSKYAILSSGLVVTVHGIWRCNLMIITFEHGRLM
jgi:hypothetical protein